MADLGINKILDISSLTNGLNKTISSDIGVIVPLIAICYIKKFTAGAVNLGGNMGMVAQGAIEAFFHVWEVNTIMAVK